MQEWRKSRIINFILIVLCHNVSCIEPVDKWWPYSPPKVGATRQRATKISENNEYGGKLLPRSQRRKVSQRRLSKETQDNLNYLKIQDDYEERRLSILPDLGWIKQIGTWGNSDSSKKNRHLSVEDDQDYFEIEFENRRLSTLQPEYPQSYHRQRPNYQRGWDSGWQDAVADRSPQFIPTTRPFYKNGYDDGYKIGLAQQAAADASTPAYPNIAPDKVPDYYPTQPSLPDYYPTQPSLPDYYPTQPSLPDYYPTQPSKPDFYPFPDSAPTQPSLPSQSYPPSSGNSNASHFPQEYWSGNEQFREGWIDGNADASLGLTYLPANSNLDYLDGYNGGWMYGSSVNGCVHNTCGNQQPQPSPDLPVDDTAFHRGWDDGFWNGKDAGRYNPIENGSTYLSGYKVGYSMGSSSSTTTAETSEADMVVDDSDDQGGYPYTVEYFRREDIFKMGWEQGYSDASNNRTYNPSTARVSYRDGYASGFRLGVVRTNNYKNYDVYASGDSIVVAGNGPLQGLRFRNRGY
eukprot:GHVL01035716.1.p1 GENE.GHVL01035716.1~~GHVL01035716.1.p1  ORF type:complete len:518 (+),score=69.25 GHVL01035716.1:49-1602(+)